MNIYRLIILGMSFTAFLWGTSFYLIKDLLEKISYEVLTFNRFFIATVVLGTWWITIGKREKIAKQDRGRLIVGGLLGGAFYYILSGRATALLPVVDLSIVSGMQPVLMMLIECLIIGTLFTERESISIALSVIGSIFLIDTISTDQTLGVYILQVSATVVWAIYYFIQKPLVLKYRPTTIIFFQFLLNTLLFLPSVLMDETFLIPLDWSLTMKLLYLGIGGSAIAYTLNSFALRKLSPTGISLFLNAGPIINIALVWIEGKRAIGGNQILGTVLIIVGVILILREWKNKYKISQ
ncbi:EamA family transporter [Niameybacter massiliensis]|uniref:EamA family transporter n=1 Tax=Holtiella tumoricola TaxID=3018743 RepID=A0AA42DND0_9FIRM|nr:EamA family transporter [Holtiella tumoricola]MDA3731846.1 EamA family transporter [Holtiella tumoricola]